MSGDTGERPSVSVVEAAFLEIINCLGPEPPKCGCQGCDAEMLMAIDAAQKGLRAHRTSVEREAAFVAAAKELGRELREEDYSREFSPALDAFEAAYGALALEREPPT